MSEQEDREERARLFEELLARAGDMGDTEFSIIRRRYIELGGWWPGSLADWNTAPGRELGRLKDRRRRGAC